MTYADLVKSFKSNPRDVHTVPRFKAEYIWFHVHVENGTLYATPAEAHKPSSVMKNPIMMPEDEFDAILDLYKRRLRGEPVSQAAKRVTRAQVYWYGVFAEML